ncbi:MAG TPA: AraC family transcriptional regulator [Pseudolabrys sp.]|nr:AraC family transcriptional regulator [Pseudolabrys sp.]
MDVLSDVLRSVRLTGGVFLDAHFTAPWCVSAQLRAGDCKAFLASPTQVIAYHVILEGTLVVDFDGEPAVTVGPGEIVIFPRNDSHTLASGPGLKPVKADDLIQMSPDGGLARIIHGGGGASTHMVCGFLGADDGYNPLIAALPRALTLDIRKGASRDWIETSVRFAAEELAAGRMTSIGVMSRLSETLLVEAVRQYASTLSEAETGWLKGLKDPHIGRALALVHKDVAASWSTDMLAREVALSRSAFIERFTELVGHPPIRYLTALRMQLAKQHLAESGRPIGQLAHLVGYESEEAFGRAFKREFGISPGAWRDQQAGR